MKYKSVRFYALSLLFAFTMGEIIISLSSCSSTCGPAGSNVSDSACRKIEKSSSTIIRIGGTAACVGVANSRKIQVSCPASSGTFGTCTSASNGSGYFLILVPNNAAGSFQDSDPAATTYTQCGDLWTAMATSPSPLVNVTGVYFSNIGAGDTVNCTDVGGCTVTSTSCVVGWDPVAGAASSTAVSLPNGTSLLGCAFISAPGGVGPPPVPGVGVAATSTVASFLAFSVSANPILFNSWTDY